MKKKYFPVFISYFFKVRREIFQKKFKSLKEFPGDDLGIRQLVKNWLQQKFEIRGLVVMDMIGWRSSPEDKIFQINSGNSDESLMLARFAMDTASYLSGDLIPAFRSRFDPYR
jgi:hypothetical protein